MLSDPTIAVVEDDADIRGNVCSYLTQSGFRAWGAESAEDFYVHLLHEHADLVVIDIGVPGEDGLRLLARLAGKGVPGVLMTVRADVGSRIAGLDAGALQYFVKPVDMQELLAGIRSLLRSKELQGRRSDITAVVPWRLDDSACVLRAPNQKAVSLTTREMELLVCLMREPGAVLGKQELVRAVGDGEIDGDFHRIESALNRLRTKTLAATGIALPVRAVFGKGLVFVP